MATINVVIRERKKTVRNLKKLLKAVDSSLELMERRQNQILSRRLKVPELSDLSFLAEKGRALEQGLRAYLTQLGRGFPV